MNSALLTTAARLLGISLTKDPAVAASLGYVNPGTDMRLAGDLGKLLGRMQSAGSFKSEVPPVLHTEGLGDTVFLQIATSPKPGRLHYTIAIHRTSGRWAVIRFGFRFDAGWGDLRSIGYNPEPDIIGGYILDIVAKFDEPTSHIDGVS